MRHDNPVTQPVSPNPTEIGQRLEFTPAIAADNATAISYIRLDHSDSYSETVPTFCMSGFKTQTEGNATLAHTREARLLSLEIILECFEASAGHLGASLLC